jgi:hypothetical protein
MAKVNLNNGTMKHIENRKKCNCRSEVCPNIEAKSVTKAKEGMQSIPTILVSILVAFFPKCPMCWAVYMSMLGSLGIAKIPYMPWLLPVFLIFLGVHLFILYKKIKENGSGPFLLSILGFALLLLGKTLFISEQWLIFSGMLLLFSGSLWNSFSFKSMQTNNKLII